MIIRFDRFIIDKFEAFAHWIQKWTGKTNYWLDGKCQLLMTYIILAGIFNYYSNHTEYWIQWFGWHVRNGLQVFVSVILMMVTMTNGIYIWKRREEIGFIRLSHGLANPLKNSFLGLCVRIFMLLPTIYYTIRSFDLYLIVVTSSIYFGSCDPLPPCSAKIKEVFKFKKLVPIEASE